jgi:response regulator NasT
MTAALRIAVADDEPDMRDYYCSTLPVLGHQVVVAARDGCEMVEACRNARPDLIITDIKMPDMDGIDAVREICRNETIPIILVSAYHDAELIDRARREHILAYLVKPIKQADLEVAISVAMQRFEEFRALRKEAGELREALEDRKLIERAKGILMKKTGLDEPEAFHRLQKLSRDKNQKMVEIARIILQADEAFRPL